MSRLKGLLYFWLAIVGAEALAVLAILAVLAFSPVWRERVWEAALIPPSPILRAVAADRLKNYPSRTAAISLVAVLNVQDKQGLGQEAAEEALSSLRELSGQAFNPPDHQGGGFDVPTSPEAWAERLPMINAWAVQAFGPDLMATLARFGGGAGTGDFSFTTNTDANGSFSFDVTAGSTAAETDLDAGDDGPAVPGDFSYQLPDGSEISFSFGDTTGLAERLGKAGVAMNSRFARAMMSGNGDELREIFDDVLVSVRNDDTAEAEVIFGFFDHPVPWSSGEDEPAAEAPEAGPAPVIEEPTAAVEEPPPAVEDGDTEDEE